MGTRQQHTCFMTGSYRPHAGCIFLTYALFCVSVSAGGALAFLRCLLSPVSSIGKAARVECTFAFGILPCNPLAGVKHLVCSKARATEAPLSTLVMESTWGWGERAQRSIYCAYTPSLPAEPRSELWREA